ncbi:set-domain histone methyltransferase-5 [Diaporthe helianthi]|uniref:Set-domain histone methyltransferase-5 n=1 Tax=Diaporthe helianthi TaxID=158607 RepID=A0A2P5IAV6_DIAHE|nr:set-domain histone methyltransferase-5 [Diaporthe helianthi]
MADPDQSPPNPPQTVANLRQNLFQYRDQNNQLQTLNLPGPARIEEHVILYPERWIWVPTVEGVLNQGWEDLFCAVCGRWGHSTRRNGAICHGQQCRAAFQILADDCRNNRIELRATPSMGLGVFATTDIPSNRVLGEYLGDLRPPTEDPNHIDHYQFTLSGIAFISATEAGNWTRFVNHNCNPNVTVGDDMYGRRRAIVFTSNRAIAAGEQLSINYGDHYFEPLRIDCTCDAHAGPHQPGGRPAMFQTPVLEPIVLELGTPIPSSPGQYQQIPRRDPSP